MLNRLVIIFLLCLFLPKAFAGPDFVDLTYVAESPVANFDVLSVGSSTDANDRDCVVHLISHILQTGQNSLLIKRNLELRDVIIEDKFLTKKADFFKYLFTAMDTEGLKYSGYIEARPGVSQDNLGHTWFRCDVISDPDVSEIEEYFAHSPFVIKNSMTGKVVVRMIP